MELSELERRLMGVQTDAIDTLCAVLDIPKPKPAHIHIGFAGPAINYLFLPDGNDYHSTGDFHIQLRPFDRSRDFAPTHVGELNSECMADAEFSVVHEAAHLIHFNYNPNFFNLRLHEDRRCKSLGSRTKERGRYFFLEENAAEFLSLLWADETGRLSRYVHQIHREGIWTHPIYHSIVSRARKIELAGVLIRIDYNGLRLIPEFAKSQEKWENLIINNGEFV